MNRFDYCVSNPPYQKKSNGNNTRNISIWQDHIFISQRIAKKASFINPGRWMTGSYGTGLIPMREYLKNSGHLESFYYFEARNLFENVDIRGGITILKLDFLKKTKQTKRFDYVEYSLREKELRFNQEIDLVIDAEDSFIVEKILSKNISNMEELMLRGNFGVAFYVIIDNNKKPLSNSLVRDNNTVFEEQINRDFKSDYRKVAYQNQGVHYKYAKKDVIDCDERLDSYCIVAFPKTDAFQIYRSKRTMVFDNGVVPTDSWIGFYVETKEQGENFISYLNTHFYRYLITLRARTQDARRNVHRWVPDLNEVVNPRTGRKGWESDWTDQDLQILFKGILTEKDWEHIKDAAINSDRKKR